jgi:hypothetical protein
MTVLIACKQDWVERGLGMKLDKLGDKEVLKVYNNFKSLGEILTGDREFEEFAGKKGIEDQTDACEKMVAYAWERYEFLFVAYINFLIVKYRRRVIDVSHEIQVQREIQRQVDAQVAAALEQYRLQQLHQNQQSHVPSHPTLDPDLD